uniref:Tumor necrosis factor ligand superfamily member 15 n=1 Tax=Pogona vitticeps TaxID=103695 RepID=A0A6J0VBM1_9SAUR
MHASEADVRTLRYLTAFCLVFSLTLSLPVLYLLRESFRAREQEMPVGIMPEAQRVKGDPPSLYSCPPSNKPRVHLSGDPVDSDPKCIPDRLQTLHWRNDRGNGDQITYQNGSVTVPQDGDYFVYAQVTYLFHDGIARETMYCGMNISAGILVEQVILKKSASYGSQEREQLRISSSIGKKEKWKTTLYLGGVIQLRENDQVMVKVSDPGLVDIHKPGRTFFGAFLI